MLYSFFSLSTSHFKSSRPSRPAAPRTRQPVSGPRRPYRCRPSLSVPAPGTPSPPAPAHSPPPTPAAAHRRSASSGTTFPAATLQGHTENGCSRLAVLSHRTRNACRLRRLRSSWSIASWTGRCHTVRSTQPFTVIRAQGENSIQSYIKHEIISLSSSLCYYILLVFTPFACCFLRLNYIQTYTLTHHTSFI